MAYPMLRFGVLFALCMLAQAMLAGDGAAQPIYKCSSGGKVSYGDRPCPGGAGTRLPPPETGVTPPEASAVATRDARTLLELEKLRIAREKAQEKEDARAQRAQARTARAAYARRKSCDKLRLRHKWAEEDLARAGGQAQDAARRKLRRQAETLAVECPA